MRVLLFVEGAKGPIVRRTTRAQVHFIRTEQTNRNRLSRLYSRWWLVECENAEAGRRVIEFARRGCEVPWHEGRILASGGRHHD